MGGRGYFVENSKCSEGVIIMAEKMPFRVNVSTLFDTYCRLRDEPKGNLCRSLENIDFDI